MIFGQEDRFLNLMGRILKNAPVYPVIAGETRMQPVFVGDVAEAAVAALDRQASGDFQLGGPQVYRHAALIDLRWRCANGGGRESTCRSDRCPLVARLTDLLPFAMPLSYDTLALLRDDNIVEDGAAGFDSLGITPVAVEAIAPTYLDQYRPRGRFRRAKMA